MAASLRMGTGSLRPSIGPTRSSNGSQPRRLPHAFVELIDQLPLAQRQVVTLRDVEGLSSSEVCGILRITEGNQRVLLHRARARDPIAAGAGGAGMRLPWHGARDATITCRRAAELVTAYLDGALSPR